LKESRPTLAGLSPEKLRVLVQRLGTTPDAPRPRSELERRGPCPLSFAQERIWFLSRMMPGNPFYNVPVAARFRAPLDVEAMRWSLGEVVRRHEAFRVYFGTPEGRPLQYSAPEVPVEAPLEDLGALPPDAREAEARRRAGEFLCRPFDLTRPPLMRVKLLRLADDDYVLLGVGHHIVFDGWCMDIFIREISALYAARVARTACLLPPLELQYLDYVRWQRERAQGGAFDAHLDAWKRQLEGAPPLALPCDRARPRVPTFRGAWLSFAVSRRATAGLKRTAREHGATPFMILLAAFKALLFRYSGQEDVVVGAPVANRGLPWTEGLIGLFANTLVLRTDLSGDPTFLELLERVRRVSVEAFARQEVPFERLVQELNPERDTSRNPLFQVAFQLEAVPALPGLAGGGPSGIGPGAVVPFELDVPTARFDLEVHLWEGWEGFVRFTGGAGDGESGLFGRISYSTDLFDPPTIESLVAHYVRLIESIAADPSPRLSELPLLTDEEERALAAAAPAERRERPTLHALFEAQVRCFADRVAVADATDEVTYAEANRRANQLAHHLRRLGVGPESLVGVCLERSIDLVIALLGVLKAGGAYVPLDPAYPTARLALMVEHARPVVLVTAGAARKALPSGATRLVDLHADAGAIAAEATADPSPQALGANLAYVIYTSGSTGEPKGVAVTHDNVTRLFEATAHWFDFGPADVWTLFHSFAFDFSVWEMWGALLHGGRLMVVPYEVSRSPEAFHDLLAREGVTVLNQTPSAFRQLARAVEERPGAEPLAVRLVVLGGEAVDLPVLRSWFRRNGVCRTVNMYGITETTVHVTHRTITPSDLDGDVAHPIGGPIPDLQLHLLDAAGHPVPTGAVGEIFVGGAGLARGYLGRPDLTAERFLPDPFANVPGARLYRSGDRARRLDGDFDYRGRGDDQVKVRGFRVELGEIESALAGHPDVKGAAVIARPGAEEDGRLVAYVVLAADSVLAASDLKRHLRDRLPGHMVPSQVVALPELPLTRNGKVDRARLLPLADAQRQVDAPYVAPRTEVERALSAVWAEVLGLERVGRQDNFFDLGGHSLLMIRAQALIRERLGREVPVLDLFRFTTVDELAAHLAAAAPAPAPHGQPGERASRRREGARRRRAARERQ
jgi:amino acid adenylation domain-containing protein